VSVTEIHGAGLAFPLQIDHRGGIALAHGEDDIAQAIGLILSTTPGERPMRPEFGCEVHDLIFDNIDAATVGKMDTAVRTALDRWEPRVEVTDVEFDLGRSADGQIVIDVTYRVRSTNHMRNLVYPFYVIPADEE
jgi:phage baseplate assembly protein W